MGKQLVLAEKPSFGRALAKFLGARGKGDGYIEGDDYVISWAMGHLVRLKMPEEYDQNRYAWSGSWDFGNLPMIPDNFLQGPFVVENWMKGETKDRLKASISQLNKVRELFRRKDIDSVIVATDAEREGTLIFWRIYEEVGSKLPFTWLWASETSEEHLKKRFSDLLPASAKQGVLDAAISRSEADWLVGLNLTKGFRAKCGQGAKLNVGRVQTPLLKILVDRFREIDGFVPSDFWEVVGKFKSGNVVFDGLWKAPDKFTESRFDDKSVASEVVKRCGSGPAKVLSIRGKENVGSRLPLFDLGGLQKAASAKYGFTAKKTLDLAQSLYEAPKSLLSYPRTDSSHLTNETFGEIGKHFNGAKLVKGLSKEIDSALGLIGIGIKFECVNDKKVSDHHAIIPTGSTYDLSKLSDDEVKIFELVCRRFCAAFMPEARYKTSVMWVTVGDDRFFVSGKVFIEFGWMDAEPWRKKSDKPLPDVKEGDILDVTAMDLVTKQTKPPAQYNDGSLITAMETAGKLTDDEELVRILKDKGIGTPATRAAHIENLIARKYAERQGKAVVATRKGRVLIDLVEPVLPDVVSPSMTGEWESKLSMVEKGSMSRDEFMSEIAGFVRDSIDKLRGTAIAPKVAGQFAPGASGEELCACSHCGKGKILDTGKTFRCDNPECGLVMWQEVGGRKLTKTMAKELASKEGRTKKEYAFTGKSSGKKFEAALKVTIDDNGRRRVSFDIPEIDRTPLGVCPRCGKGNVVEGPRAFGCDRYADQSSPCSFAVWKERASTVITREIVEELLRDGRTSKVMKFKSRKGADFEAFLVVGENDKGLIDVTFDFPQDRTVESVGKCPECGKDVLDKPVGFGCSGYPDCTFMIWRNLMGKELPKSVAKELLEKGETSKEMALTSKAGKKFSTRLRLVNGKVEFVKDK